jgi:heptosyltransferase-2
MKNDKEQTLIWLPSPMGDAILCTPALRAIRRRFSDWTITFFCSEVVHQILWPCSFNDKWIIKQSNNPFHIANTFGKERFNYAVLLKNSFGSALTCFLAGIGSRVGYSREGRGIFLTEKLYPPKTSAGNYKPFSMIDYYLAIASRLGCDTRDRTIELAVNQQENENLRNKIPEIIKNNGPVVILVPGGAFGPSKCWPAERFAQLADKIIDNYDARVIISVSSAPQERSVAESICNLSKAKNLINLGQRTVTIGELKALFSIAELVITNDTGPRHIAIAFKRNVITLFGPNDPAWTETGWNNEIKIIGKAPCAPCAKPVCRQQQHLCMLDISVEKVYKAAESFLSRRK